MPTLSGQSRFAGDDGSADPDVSAALAAFAVGRGSEHAALTALAAGRLLVPLVSMPSVAAPSEAGLSGAAPSVAVPSEAAPPGAAPSGAGLSGAAPPGAAPSGAAPSGVGRAGASLAGAGVPDRGGPVTGSGRDGAWHPGRDAGPDGCDHGEERRSGDAGRHGRPAGQPAAEMAMPRLVGRDGRPAIPAFTCLDALARWQRAARPVPADPAVVWRTAVEESCAVVIDVAGPVPVAIEGARLAALAAGRAVPPPQEDPDIAAAVAAAVAEHAPGAGFALRPAPDGADLTLELALPPGLTSTQAAAVASRVGQAAMARLGGRLRRGVAVAVT